jgi:hypothetical protein
LYLDADERSKRKLMKEEEKIQSIPFKPEIGEINKVLGSKEETTSQFVDRLTNEKFEWQRQIDLAKSLLEQSQSDKTIKVTRPVHS